MKKTMVVWKGLSISCWDATVGLRMEKSAIQYMDTSSEVEIFFHLTKQKIFELGGNTAVT